MLDQLALGLVVGAAIGLLAGSTVTAAFDLRGEPRRAALVTAVAIAAAGVAVVVLVWLS